MIKTLHFLNDSEIFLYLALTVNSCGRRLAIRIYDRWPPDNAHLIAPYHSLSWRLDTATRKILNDSGRIDIIDHCHSGLPLYSCRANHFNQSLITISQPPTVWPP